MTNELSKLLDKVSSYQLFNYIFPGVLFIEGIEQSTSILFPSTNVWFRVFIYYISGMVLSRVGSLFIEPVYKRLCWVVYAKYGNYLKALEKDSKLDVLVMENNTYRTLVATFLLMLIIYILDKFSWFQTFNDSILSLLVYFGLLIFIFSVSFNKQTSFVRQRTHHDLGLKDSEELPILKEEQKKSKKKEEKKKENE